MITLVHVLFENLVVKPFVAVVCSIVVLSLIPLVIRDKIMKKPPFFGGEGWKD